ncbi:tyrosine-type recombinase/integrase [Desulfoscipio gibsoniae]|uniref:Site-specific recombinase XerD n=1 Tax=Desulfoscipio gibsoniae DSM 7213 TaxID=767817 RepID=R4KLE8_9FIRM|nr:tyrosine-type recombinase/integrase [Desulfoscipio gibsoniae]AGL02402.1 site-specific recombinase XerD [Desulfoscipio gibsoniae DSM 7213]
MTKLESTIKIVLDQLRPKLASETWESRRRYFNQMLQCAESLGITEPCAELYDAFIADDNGSPERRSLHIRCVKLVDELACTHAKDEHGILFNEPPMPCEAEVQEFFNGRKFPIAAGVRIDYLIVKAEIEINYLHLTVSTMGQYKHSWMDIRRYFYDAGISEYDEALMQSFIQRMNSLRSNGFMKEWKWKINRKAAYVLMEIADTGHFQWGLIKRDTDCGNLEIESIRSQYLKSLEQRNLSKATIGLHDYVFRKMTEFTEIDALKDLKSLAPETIQLAVTKFADICNRRSMATIIPILRSLLEFLYAIGLLRTNLSGIVMGVFVQKGSVAAYLSEKDQANLMSQLEKEPKRTKAIILLAMKLGLRDCDICSLTFQEIDWRKDRIRLNQKKTGVPLALPLLPDIGNALMDYILNERPKRTDHYPYIFLRKQAPYNKLSSVYSICSKLLERQKVKPVNGTAKGTHLFRYSMVHRLLAAKVPHQVITDVLGHVSKESDKPYISMEESMLRMCALDLSVIGRVSWRGGTSDD